MEHGRGDNQKIRLVALDLDGTLLNDAKAVGERTAAAIKEAGARGVRVVIASARPPRSVRGVYASLGLGTWQINYNGAMIWDEPARKVVYHQPMSCDLVRRMIHTARQLDEKVLVSCEILDRWYTDADPALGGPTTATGKLFRPDVIAPVEEFCTEPVTKLLLLGQGSLMTMLSRLLLVRYGKHVSILRSDEDLLQIMDRRCGKGMALRRVAQHYRVEMGQILAIGDAENDIDMLGAAGVAVVMGNAPAEVKRVAHWVAPSNNAEGVGEALRRFGVCG